MKYRVYFNKSGCAENAWSIDDGDQDHEQNFRSVQLLDKTVTSIYAGKRPWPEPSAWFEVHGELQIDGKDAVIK